MSVVILLSYTSDVCDVLCGRELVCNNAVLCTLCVYISIISDIDRGVFHCSVTVTVKADDVAALDVFFCNFLTLLGLACSAVRERDVVVVLVAVHNETGTVEALRRRRTAGYVLTADKALDILSEISGLITDLG